MALRTEPVQACSSARLDALLDAAAQIVDEVGVEHLATNLVAERAGSSIGTLYRYFPDRIAVLRGLALRNASILHEDLRRELEPIPHDGAGLQLLLLGFAERIIEHFRREPGWSAIGFAHTLDLPLDEGQWRLVVPGLRGQGSPRLQLARLAAAHFSRSNAELRELAAEIETVLFLTQALVERAFAVGRNGDDDLLEHARSTIARIVERLTATHPARRSAAGDAP